MAANRVDKQRCIVELMRADPDRASAALGRLKVDGERDLQMLAAVPATSADWLDLASAAQAQQPDDPTLAVNLVKVAERQADPDDADTQQAIAIAKLDLAKTANRSDLRAEARGTLVSVGKQSTRARLGAIAALAAAGDEVGVTEVCAAGVDISNVWACVEGSPGALARYLPIVAKTPVLAAEHVEILARVDKAGVLPGLRDCAAGWSPDPIGVFTDRAKDPTPGAVELYYRLHEVVGGDQGTCLLERAAAGCFAMIENSETCPVPFAFADYMRRLDRKDRERFLDSMIARKGAQYIDLRGGSRQARFVLYHLHLVLAELLVGRRASERVFFAGYHLGRAHSFREDRKISFGAVLAPTLKEAVCAGRICGACQWPNCRPACERELEPIRVEACR